MSEPGPEPESDAMSEETPAAKAGAMILILGSIFPGMMIAGFFPEWGSAFGLIEWLAIGAAIGAFGGLLFVHGKGPWHIGAICGALLCVVAPLALHLYVNAWDDRQTFQKIELALVWVVSVLPPVWLYQTWLARARR